MGAIYSFDMATVRRAKGQSAVASAAYLARDRRRDERTGRIANHVGGWVEVLAHGVVGPADWPATERAERRRDAVVGRTLILALPEGLAPDAQGRLVAGFAGWLREEHGVCAEWAVHAAPVASGGDERNVHAHVLISSRRVAADGRVGAKTTELDDPRSGGPVLTRWRRQWQDKVNLTLAEHGRPERVDCRSLRERGIGRPPRRHLGPQATAQVRSRRGRGGYRPAAARHNGRVDRLEAEIAQIDLELARLEAERTANASQTENRDGQVSRQLQADGERHLEGELNEIYAQAQREAERCPHQRDWERQWEHDAPAPPPPPELVPEPGRRPRTDGEASSTIKENEAEAPNDPERERREPWTPIWTNPVGPRWSPGWLEGGYDGLGSGPRR